MTTLALVGNPNCGKTTLFNALTGTHQRIGNWPGVTVERKDGSFKVDATQYRVVDLPGIYDIDAGGGLDEAIAREYLASDAPDLIVNIVDASALSRGLYLTNQLLQLDVPMVVAVNMTDVAKADGITIDPEALAAHLGCPVVPMAASKGLGVDALRTSLSAATIGQPITRDQEHTQIYAEIDRVVDSVIQQTSTAKTTDSKIDRIVLNRFLAFPIFLGVMYLMFLFAINVGSAFIDWFDLTGQALFVEFPRQLLASVGTPDWLNVLIADGVGGGVQLVGTFIPVIAALFLVLSLLEDSGYMARVAFIVDRLLHNLGLPGKAFVPLIVGFGCNVPAVMATRALDSEPDRILTTLMAPYMSCGARLTVYALFAAAFFPRNGQNIVFLLYVIGIVVAILSALAVRRHLLPQSTSQFVMELPPYHLPVLRNVLIQTWQRLRGFVLRAGKAIVLVVVVLNVVNSIGVDGSVGNENSENSVLSNIGKSLTPAFAPMGIKEDNWPATVGIFTGIFAKEVVVGTLDALYSPAPTEDVGILELLRQGLASIPENLAALGDQLGDPLGLSLGDLDDLDAQATAQEVTLSTVQAMQYLFDGQLGAFAYLLFILLYMPCVATIGVIFKEIGGFWATYSVVWSFVVAYAAAVWAYQIGQIASNPSSALSWSAFALGLVIVTFIGLVRWGKQRRDVQLIPLRTVD